MIETHKGRCGRFWIALGILHLSFGLSLAASGLSTRGEFVSDLQGWHHLSEGGKDSLKFAGINRFTLKSRNRDRKHAKVELELDLFSLHGQYAGAYSQAFSGTALSQSPEMTPVLADLRKFYFSAFLPKADVSIGRQIINFGKGTVFSPIDAFSTVDVMDLNFRRKGSDVARIRAPFSDLAGTDIVVGLPAGDNDHASALKVFGNIAGFDFSGVGIYRHRSRKATGGISFKGDAIVGIKGELVEHYVRDTEVWALETMLGVDYSWENTWLALVEYLYQQDKSSGSATVDTHQLFGSLQYIINEITNVSIGYLGEFRPENYMVTAQVYRNVMQNVDVILYMRAMDFENAGIPLPQVEYAARVSVKF